MIGSWSAQCREYSNKRKRAGLGDLVAITAWTDAEKKADLAAEVFERSAMFLNAKAGR